MLTRPHDKLMEADTPGRFKRYSSLAAAGIDINDMALSRREQETVPAMIRQWKERFIRLMQSKFRVPAMVRAEIGQLLNTDEALEGVAECYRRVNQSRKAPLRIGINVSRDYAAASLTSMRGGAILALLHLCKQRGQQVEISLAYGNGMKFRTCPTDVSWAVSRCHVRIDLRNANEGMLTNICCSSETISVIGNALVRKHGNEWRGSYRFYEFPWERKGNPEFDFVLDRIDTPDEQTEYNRIVTQLQKFGVMGK